METIKQSDINAKLQGKLYPEDILKSSDRCKNSALKNRLNLDLLAKSKCEGCPIKHLKINNVVPEGNPSSSLMFILEKPTEKDGLTMTTAFDAPGRVLTTILDKMRITRDNIYITPVAKCAYGNDFDISYCVSSYLLREIAFVKPHKIIVMGELPAKALRESLGNIKITNENSSLLESGQVYSVFTDNLKIDILQTISTDVLITKAGALYDSYKLNLWNQIVNFIKS